MIHKRLHLVLFAIPFAAVALLTIAADRPHPSVGVIDPSCASSLPCIEYDNHGSGPAVRGVGHTGNGLSGEATFNSTSASNGRAGVIGADISTSGTFDAGVKGTSTNGSGVQGTSVDGYGVMATSTNQSALFVQNLGASDGIQAIALSNDGTNSSTQNKSGVFLGVGRSGVWGHDDSTDGGRLNVGVEGSSTNGIGVQGNSTNFVGVNAVGGFTDLSNDGDFYPALSIVGDISNGYTPTLINACPSGAANPCDENTSVFKVGQNGNISITGEIFTSTGSCCAVRQRVRFYTPRESLPTVEDFGEAQLTAGRAYVRIDPAFASTIDQHANYFVFITPEGDANTLYVSQKSGNGFSVTESREGRDSITFQYRIVAKPYGENAPRLQRFLIHLPTDSHGRVFSGTPRTLNQLR